MQEASILLSNLVCTYICTYTAYTKLLPLKASIVYDLWHFWRVSRSAVQMRLPIWPYSISIRSLPRCQIVLKQNAHSSLKTHTNIDLPTRFHSEDDVGFVLGLTFDKTQTSVIFPVSHCLHYSGFSFTLNRKKNEINNASCGGAVICMSSKSELKKGTQQSMAKFRISIRSFSMSFSNQRRELD